jgi:hypothetical protein
MQNRIKNKKIYSKERNSSERLRGLKELIKLSKKYSNSCVTSLLEKDLKDEQMSIQLNNIRRKRQSIIGF